MARMKWPKEISFNAFTGGEPVSGKVSPDAEDWVLDSEPEDLESTRLPAQAVDLRNWRHPDVGWGLILADTAGLSDATRANGDDAPAEIRELLKERAPAGESHAPVFRYHPGSDANRLGFLRNYADRNAPEIASSDFGTQPGQIPRYLLIYGTPQEVPWDLQYILNTRGFVGRLDLTGDGLKNYVKALLDEWKDAKSDPLKPLVWSVDDRVTAITKLMRDVIAAPLAEKYGNDSDLSAGLAFFDGSAEKLSAAKLVQELAARNPGVIVTTSHGMTGPLDDPAAMARDMGKLVDTDSKLVEPDALVAAWEPDGAIWYAHACSSAGSDGRSRLAGALKVGSAARTMLEGVAQAGALVSPTPRKLLGAAKPLRAFVGQVEPTADWTLVNKKTHQRLTGAIHQSLYNHLFAPPQQPIGMALSTCYDRVGTLLATYVNASLAADGGVSQRPEMAHVLLAALDQQSMVILGDPTATLSISVD